MSPRHPHPLPGVPESTLLFPRAAERAGPGMPVPALLSPRELWVMLWRHIGLIAGCVLLASVLALAVALAQKPVYASTARVWIQTEQQGTPSFLSGIAAYRESQYLESATRKIETEMELMLTRSNATAVVDALGVLPEQLPRSALAQFTALLPGLPQTAKPDAAAPARTVVDQFIETVSVQPLRSKTAETASNVLEVRFESADPALAPRALSVLLDNYLRSGAQQNQRLGEATAKLIQTKLAQAKAELRQVDDSIVELAMSGSSLAAMTAVGDEPPRRSTGVGAGGGAVLRLDVGGEGSRVGNAQAVTLLKTQTLDLEARLDELRQVYTDNAENVRDLRNRVEATKRRLSRSVREGARADAEYSRLERLRALVVDRYVELQKKLDQIDLYLQLNPTAVDSRVVIDPPSAAKRGGSKRLLIALMGPIGGLMLGLLLAGLRELFDTRLRSAAEVERALGLPTLALVPNLSFSALSGQARSLDALAR